MNSNMVESPKKGQEEASKQKTAGEEEMMKRIARLLLPEITIEDLEYDLFRLERKFRDVKVEDDQEKIDFVIDRSEKMIGRWYMDLSLEMNTEKLNYEKFKSLLLERFVDVKLTLTEFFSMTQRSQERIADFIRRMETAGRTLKQPAEVRMQAIKLGVRKFRDRMRDEMVGENKVTPKLLEKLTEAETLEMEREAKRNKMISYEKPRDRERNQDRRVICFRCGAEGHIAPNCSNKGKSINQIIQNVESLNKSNFIYFNRERIAPIFDTGAEDNYVTLPLAERLKLRITKLPIVKRRYTCLAEPFDIEAQVKIKFEYQGVEYNEICEILPKRKDCSLLLGNKWIQKVAKGKSEEQEKVNEEGTLIEKLFEGRKEGIAEPYECTIEAKEEDCISEGPSIIAQALQVKVQEKIEELKDKGYIRESKSNWSHKVRPVTKDDGSVRLTTNFILLNQKVPLDRYSLPRIDTMLTSLRGYTYFSKIDLKDGFFQVPLKEEDRHKTAFMINNKLYEWNRMPMGFKNSPAVFQRLMDRILKEEIGKRCVVYVDDILIFSKTEQDHEEDIKKVVTRLVKAGLKANKEKCIFRVKEIDFLGHKITKNKILPTEEKTKTIENFPAPTDIEGVRRFLGLINYYRDFIPKCSETAIPLTLLLKKNEKFLWDSEQQQAFENLKIKLNKGVELNQPDFEQRFILETDASNQGLGAVLLQETEGKKIPIAFASKTLTDTEKRYSITEKEMLGALWAMEHFHYYLYGREFTLRSDHKALEAFNSKGYLNSDRIARWMERIQNYSFEVEYVKGESIPHVDALSRQDGLEDRNIINEIIQEDEKTKIVRVHEKLIHRGAKEVWEKLKEEGYNEATEGRIRDVLKGCIICKMYNPLRSRPYRYIEAYTRGEIVGIDIIEPVRGTYIITAIDYFTRKGFAQKILSKKSKEIVDFLKRVHSKIKIKRLITDGARENLSKEVKSWVVGQGIQQHTTSPYHHQSNGRIERFNQTLLKTINKLKIKGSPYTRVSSAVDAYNDTFHRSIGMTPNQAQNSETWESLKQKQFEDRVANNAKFLLAENWPKMEIGDLALLKEEINKKKNKPLFNKLVEVVEVGLFDTYLVRKESGRPFKRHISQLKPAGGRRGNVEFYDSYTRTLNK